MRLSTRSMQTSALGQRLSPCARSLRIEPAACLPITYGRLPEFFLERDLEISAHNREAS